MPTENTPAVGSLNSSGGVFNPAVTGDAGFTAGKIGTPDTTIDASQIGKTQPFNVPNSAPTNAAGNALGASVNPPIPTGDTTEANRTSAVNQEAYLQSILNPSEDTANTEATFGISGLKTAADQANNDALAVKAHYDALIDQARTNSAGATGAGVQSTVDNLTRQRDSQLASIAIRQSVATGDLTRMQDLVTKKVAADTDAVQGKITALKDYIANVDADPAEKAKMTAQANQQQALLDEKKTATESALKNAAQNNAPQSTLDAISKASQDPNSTAADITKAAGRYGVDPKVASDIAYQRAETNKLNIENAQNNNQPTVPVIGDDGKPVVLPVNVAPYYNTSHSGVGYIDASTLEGTASDKKSIITDAQKAGLKVILNKNEAADLTNIKDANSKIDTVTKFMADVDQPGALQRDLYGYGLTQLAILAQTDPKKAASEALPMIGLDILKAVSGIQGFRGGQSVIQAVQKELPSAGDTADTVLQKTQLIRAFLNDRENAVVGKPANNNSSTSSGGSFTIGGQKVNVGQQVKYSDGKIGTVQADGSVKINP